MCFFTAVPDIASSAAIPAIVIRGFRDIAARIRSLVIGEPFGEPRCAGSPMPCLHPKVLIPKSNRPNLLLWVGDLYEARDI